MNFVSVCLRSTDNGNCTYALLTLWTDDGLILNRNKDIIQS